MKDLQGILFTGNGSPNQGKSNRKRSCSTEDDPPPRRKRHRLQVCRYYQVASPSVGTDTWLPMEVFCCACLCLRYKEKSFHEILNYRANSSEWYHLYEKDPSRKNFSWNALSFSSQSDLITYEHIFLPIVFFRSVWFATFSQNQQWRVSMRP